MSLICVSSVLDLNLLTSLVSEEFLFHKLNHSKVKYCTKKLVMFQNKLHQFHKKILYNLLVLKSIPLFNKCKINPLISQILIGLHQELI